MMNFSGNRRLEWPLSAMLIVCALGFVGLRPVSAEDESEDAVSVAEVASGDAEVAQQPLTVRDAGVYLLSAYGKNLNDRGLFQATLPGFTLSRRPTAPRQESNIPTPISLLTFSGPPSEDIDILLEFDAGRFLSHWPPARMRSKRLLWAGLSTSVEAPDVPSRLPNDHWLSPLRKADRLYAASRGRCDRALMYDAELKYKPHVTLEREETNYRVKNKGEFPIHDVHVYRHTGDGEWSVWSVDTIVASKKIKKPKSDEETEDDEESAEEVFDKTDDEPAESEDESESESEDDGESEGEQKKPASGQKAGLAGFIAKVKSGEMPGSTKSKGSSATVSEVGTFNADEALEGWTQRLLELGLGDVEADHITTVLKAQAFRTDAAMLVYRMDDAQLEKLLPLEVTPYPDRLFRVAVVIVQDADPDLLSQIEGLVKQLGDDRWPEREAAQEKLHELGLAAKPKLEDALKHDDTEVVFRAEQLLESLQTKP